MINLLLIIFSEIIDIIYDYCEKLKDSYNEDALKITLYEKIFKIIMMSKALLYLISFVLIYFVRKNLIDDLESSPLLRVDDSLTEEMYNEIIHKSKHPDISNIHSKNISINQTQNSSLKSNTLGTISH